MTGCTPVMHLIYPMILPLCEMNICGSCGANWATIFIVLLVRVLYCVQKCSTPTSWRAHGICNTMSLTPRMKLRRLSYPIIWKCPPT